MITLANAKRLAEVGDFDLDDDGLESLRRRLRAVANRYSQDRWRKDASMSDKLIADDIADVSAACDALLKLLGKQRFMEQANMLVPNPHERHGGWVSIEPTRALKVVADLKDWMTACEMALSARAERDRDATMMASADLPHDRELVLNLSRLWLRYSPLSPLAHKFVAAGIGLIAGKHVTPDAVRKSLAKHDDLDDLLFHRPVL